jgi:phosphoribosyl 1,2-cyclic phosphodiesterase
MGTRGSIASPGPDTVGFGGNTPCVEVMAAGHRLIFDAGTGIRALGDELAAAGSPVHATIFLTHFHWDHIQGLPFFAPAWDEASEIHVVGPAQTGPDGEEVGVEQLVDGLMGTSYFPMPMSAMSGVRTYGHLNEGTWERDRLTVRAMRVKHPAFTVGYRVTADGRSIAYVPDNELLSDAWPMSADWRARFVGFLSGVDLLIHDAMYTDAEYGAHAGHGHSTYHQAMDVAEEAGVGDLLFFHHDPGRSDEALEELVDRMRNDALAEGRTVGIRAAREGDEIVVGESGVEAADDG